MTNTTKQFPKYIVVVDHTAYHSKMWSFIALTHDYEPLAIAEGSRKGFLAEECYCIHIAKRGKKRNGEVVYNSIVRVYENGWCDDTTDETIFGDNFNNWNLTIDDIEFDD